MHCSKWKVFGTIFRRHRLVTRSVRVGGMRTIRVRMKYDWRETNEVSA